MTPSDPGKEFAEIWAEAVTSSRHLRLFTLVLGGGLLLLLVAVVRLSGVDAPRPIVIRVDEVGRAEALAYEAGRGAGGSSGSHHEVLPQSVLDRLLLQADGHGAVGVVRALRFLTVDLANAAFRTESESVASVAAGVTVEELQVEGVVLRIQPQPEPPHGAAADFDLVTIVRGEELSRERWTASLQFTFLEAVPADLLPTNPMGLLVTFLQSDRAAAF